MKFREFVDYLEKLDAITSRLDMTDIATDLFKKTDDLPIAVLFVQGRVFPSWDRTEVGIAEKTMIKALSTATGATEKKISTEIAKTGDTGKAAAKLFHKKAQQSLTARKLTLKEVNSMIRKLPTLEGSGSTTKKIKYTVELLNFCDEHEVKFLVRLLLGEMRLGVGEGIVRDAIAKAFDVDAALVEKAASLANDYAEVAEAAKKQGEKGLKAFTLRVNRPIKPMLAQSVSKAEEALEKFSPAQFEYKFDGMRTQVHVHKGEVTLFTRRLDDVTHQFPDIAAAVKKAVHCDDCIIEGEAVAVKNGKPQPFQLLSRRIKRKYDIKKMVKDIPVVIYLFDVMFLNGESFVDADFKTRRKALKDIVKETADVKLSDALVTKNAAEADVFYEAALEMGHEGVMIKNLEAPYRPGSRVGYMYKLKPATETLDLVVVGAEWGEGRRAKWLGSYLLACRDPDTNEFLACGKMATGMKDEQLQYLTDLLKNDILEESGKELRLKPRLVVECGYQELQKSPTYKSGYALRFPRLVRIREDRAAEECETIDRIAEMYERSR